MILHVCRDKEALHVLAVFQRDVEALHCIVVMKMLCVLVSCLLHGAQ
jgi:hypothetical protein